MRRRRKKEDITISAPLNHQDLDPSPSRKADHGKETVQFYDMQGHPEDMFCMANITIRVEGATNVRTLKMPLSFL